MEQDAGDHDVRAGRAVPPGLERDAGAGASDGLDHQREEVAGDEDGGERARAEARVLWADAGDDDAEDDEHARGHERGRDDRAAYPTDRAVNVRRERGNRSRYVLHEERVEREIRARLGRPVPPSPPNELSYSAAHHRRDDPPDTVVDGLGEMNHFFPRKRGRVCQRPGTHQCLFKLTSSERKQYDEDEADAAVHEVAIQSLVRYRAWSRVLVSRAFTGALAMGHRPVTGPA